MTAKKKSKKKRPVRKPPEQKQPEQKPVVEVTPPPTAGKKVIDFEQKLDEQIAGGPSDPKKRGRGRPPKESQQPEPVPAVVGSNVIKDAVCVPFDMWARSQRLKGLRLTDEEAQTLVDPIRILLDYYLPEVPAIAYAWAALVITAYAITSPRLLLIEDERKLRQSKNEALRNSDQAKRSDSNADIGRDQGGSPGPSDRFPRTDEITPLKIEN